ncbi:dimethyl sulfone monooxygenase SfnG [Ancylobacter sp. 6x-1]|uniref:Dimethyl sulfone monooxygenase SfnG n=1 Tax=Ancylobacter crimeensis TaxID=2579147 RepID=A0ABT0DFH9_9HYPH|nr:dimethyl sulfone monooxygenase SfnG [Ancylobacter crimeensis]MCK0198710.1 dimethyl sulfone monooxygenase SfnG [Ancylobacter crimeensis]
MTDALTPYLAEPVRFAYWVSNLSGGQVVSGIEQRTGWDFAYNVKLARAAEAAGFDFALTATRLVGGYRADGQHEASAFAMSLLNATERLNVIVAVMTGFWHPAVVAKLGATADHISGGRWHLNIVSGWFKHEFDVLGVPWLEHDERYRRSAEFIQVLKGIWTEDVFSFHGDHYNIDSYHLNPKPSFKPHPLIFQGGSSTAARHMAAAHSDWYFTNGGTVEELGAQARQVKQGAAGFGRQLRVGANAFIIARDSEAEARAVHAEILARADLAAVAGFAEAVKEAGASTKDGIGNWARSGAADLVQPNDGFRTNLIGTPEEVARRIVALKQAGVDLILAGFLHFQEEVEYFGRRVLPLVREIEAEAARCRPEPAPVG